MQVRSWYSGGRKNDLRVLYSPVPQKLELYVLSLPWTQTSKGGVHDAYAFSSPLNLVTFEIRYRFSIIAAFLFKSISSYIIMVPILENQLTFPLCVSFNGQKSRRHFV